MKSPYGRIKRLIELPVEIDCEKLINRIEFFYTCKSLTKEEYEDLMKMLGAEKNENSIN